MLSSRIFQITLLISIIAHGAILFQNPHLNPFPTHTKEQDIEVSYIKPPQETKSEPKTQLPKREPFLNLPSKIALQKRIPPPYIEKVSEPNFSKPAIIKPDIIAIKKKITLPPIDMNKINNPSYISYYQIVREKIKRSAYYNYSRTETGEVYVSFIISNNGYLKDAQLVQEKSSSSPYLREIALKSVKDASPFPDFPKELEYPHLSFNVVISFEIE